MDYKRIATGASIGKDLCEALNLDVSKVNSIQFGVIDNKSFVTATVEMSVYEEEMEEVMSVFKRYHFVEIPEDEMPDI
ncbi:hypothetical protein VPH49_25380 [Pseudomonas luteola]|uniref:hypothetical protein n=1 Tax=Pseudomonas luteola TaxID=47886 RepID=UPI003A8BC9F5